MNRVLKKPVSQAAKVYQQAFAQAAREAAARAELAGVDPVGVEPSGGKHALRTPGEIPLQAIFGESPTTSKPKEKLPKKKVRVP